MPLRHLPFVAAAIFLAGCSAPASRDGAPSSNGPAAHPPGGPPDTPSLGGGDAASPPFSTDGGATSPSDCSDAAKLVYVVTQENSLLSFAPDKLAFTPIGTLTCPSSGFPFSMAVDRSGTAWVLYTDGNLYKVSTKDASCAPANLAPRSGKFYLFGMGFSTDGAGSESEKLYVSDLTGNGLGSIDLTTMTLSPIGAYTGALTSKNSELTGTGDGKLYGFFTTSPAQLARITKGSGTIEEVHTLDSVFTGTDWAFSFWGGDFYFYTAPPPVNASDGLGSDVTRYRPADGSIEVLRKSIGFRIVGAGVSTCAPLTPPPPK
jgi:hypothetical protein